MLHKRNSLICLFLLLFNLVAQAGGGEVNLESAPIDRTDKASLQRGARIFVNYCLGCHSAKYLRYKQVAKDLGIVDENGEVRSNLIKEQLNFVSDKVTDSIQTSMLEGDAANWFGTPPPDLSLVARVRGVDWLYTYLRTFYSDPSRPFGVNNLVFPGVGMPHVLLSLQGVQEAEYRAVLIEQDGDTIKREVVDRLILKQPGSLTVEQYDTMVADLVNFLDYMGEPAKLERQHLGVWVLLFLVVFTLFAYLLKREYWKDVH